MSAELSRTTLGRTGLEVTRLGIGGCYCESVAGYRQALDCGVNYVDTARVYRDGDDERVIGEAIQGRRHQLVLATKTGQRRGDGLRRELETSLRQLQTDYIDIYQLHGLDSRDGREQALAPGGAVDAARKAQEQGLIRFLGLTGHVWDEIGQGVATGVFDTVLCWYNCAMKEPESAVFPAAAAHDVGVVIMNAGRNDRLFSASGEPPEDHFYRYVLEHPTVDLTIMGLRNTERFARIAADLAKNIELSAGQRVALENHGGALRRSGKLD